MWKSTRLGSKIPNRLPRSVRCWTIVCCVLELLAPRLAEAASTYDTARSYVALGRLQKQLCDARKAPVCHWSIDDCIVSFNSKADPDLDPTFVAEFCRNMPGSGTETPGVFMMLQGYQKSIVAVLPELGFALPTEPALGSLPLDGVNATVTTDEDERARIVAVNSGLFILAISIPKVAAFSVPITEQGQQGEIDLTLEGTLNRLQTHTELMPQFVGALLTGFGLMYEPLPDAQGLEQPIIVSYMTGIETFALAHEYAHILLNHSAPAGALGLEENCQVQAAGIARTTENSWIQEVEADLLAQRILNAIASHQRADAGENPLIRNTLQRGPGYYFLLTEIRRDTSEMLKSGSYPTGPMAAEEDALKIIETCLDRAGCDVRTALRSAKSPVLDLKSHPHPSIRRRIVEHEAAKLLPGGGADEDVALAISRLTYRNTQIMWDLTRPKLRQLYDNGVRLSGCSKGGTKDAAS